MTTLYERIKAARLALGKTQKYIAEMAKINPRTYINYEQGEREMPASLMVVYSSLGIDSTWLLTGKGEMFQRPERSTASDDDAELFSGILGGGFSELVDAIETLENNVPADVLKDFYKVVDVFPPKLREQLLITAKQYYERNTIEDLARKVEDLKKELAELKAERAG